jgi:MFS family permease
MGLTTGAWSLGLIFGPAIGGYLARPAIKYPSLVEADSIFVTFPYLMPNIVIAILGIISLILLIYKFPETLQINNNDTNTGKAKSYSISEILKIPDVFITISSNFFIALMSMIFDEVFPLWVYLTKYYQSYNYNILYIILYRLYVQYQKVD